MAATGMKKKARKAPEKETWTLPAFADRRAKPRPAKETPAQRAKAAKKRKQPL